MIRRLFLALSILAFTASDVRAGVGSCGTSANSFDADYGGAACSTNNCSQPVSIPSGAAPGCLDLVFLNIIDNAPTAANADASAPAGWKPIPVSLTDETAQSPMTGACHWGTGITDLAVGFYRFHQSSDPSSVTFSWNPSSTCTGAGVPFGCCTGAGSGSCVSTTTWLSASYGGVDPSNPFDPHASCNNNEMQGTLTPPNIMLSVTPSHSSEELLSIWPIGNSPAWPDSYSVSLGTIEAHIVGVGGQGTLLSDEALGTTAPTGNVTLSSSDSGSYWGAMGLMLAPPQGPTPTATATSMPTPTAIVTPPPPTPTPRPTPTPSPSQSSIPTSSRTPAPTPTATATVAGGSGPGPVNLNQTGSFNAASGSVPIASSRAGDAIFVLVTIADPNSGGVSSISDNAGNSYSRQVNNANAGGYVDLWAAFNVAAGATSVRVNIAPSDPFAVSVNEFSGIATSDALDTSWRDSSPTNNMYFFPGSGQTVGQTNELAIGLGTANALKAPGSPSDGWSGLSAVTSNSLLGGAYVVASSTVIPQSVLDFSSMPPDEVMLAASFKAAGPSTPTPIPTNSPTPSPRGSTPTPTAAPAPTPFPSPVSLNHVGNFNGATGAVAIPASRSGDAIFVLVTIADPLSNGVASITDTAGNIYTRQVNDANAGGYVDLWAAFDVTSGATSVTVEVSPSDKFAVSVGEFSGVAASNALDQTWTDNNDSSNLYFFAGSGEPVTQSNELAIGVGTADALAAPGAASNGWTALSDVTTNSLLAGAYTIGSSTTIAQTVRPFSSPPPNEVMLAVTFRAAAAP